MYLYLYWYLYLCICIYSRMWFTLRALCFIVLFFNFIYFIFFVISIFGTAAGAVNAFRYSYSLFVIFISFSCLNLKYSENQISALPLSTYKSTYIFTRTYIHTTTILIFLFFPFYS